MSRFAAAVLALLLSAAAAQAQVRSAWVQLTGQGAEARAVVAGACPTALIDGQPAAMRPRAAASAQFPTVCSLAVPAFARTVSVGDQTLAAPGRDIRRIVIMGDTGCRVTTFAVQACNESREWPFATVTRLAAARKPDLVIHVGDYYYREAPCPAGVAVCAGSPWGDRWETWAAEFFDPAAPLLAAAPWVFARGNHEGCSRGGRGWYLLLEAGPAPQGCPALSDPFTVRAGDLNLHVLDSADAADRVAGPAGVANVARQLDRLGAPLNQGSGWIVTHRPVWGLVPVARVGPVGPLRVGINLTEQRAVRGRPMGGVQLVVSGHIHDFQALTFGPQRPAQLIVGTGGDFGEAADTPKAYGGPTFIDGMDAASLSFSRYGYFVMERDGEDWTGTFHDADDIVRATCTLRLRQLACATPGARTDRPAG